MEQASTTTDLLELPVRPVAWLHDQFGRYDVVHDEAKALWLKAWPKQVEHYTIPLYRHVERQPLSTEAACALLKATLGMDPLLDGNVLKIVREVERVHGIGHDLVSSRCMRQERQMLGEDYLRKVGSNAGLGVWEFMHTAPKDGTAILVLLNGSDIPICVRWLDVNDPRSTCSEGWYVTWDGSKVRANDGPRRWMWCPDDPDF